MVEIRLIKVEKKVLIEIKQVTLGLLIGLQVLKASGESHTWAQNTD